ncbi:PilW family protein [Balneatrix alpica]|uniref:PilW family protein n=1 Tax=Balneatrix alpica TaxID=75684 RepID=A0ABV5ZBH4_9GAMM|nr:PilW family protein [Balneatrix alpica]
MRGHYQRGLSLVELMIAMTIGLLLMLGVLEVLLSGRQTYMQTRALANLQESARFSQLFISDQLRHAGFNEDPIQSMSTAFPASNVPVANIWAAGQVVAGETNNANNADAILNGSDTVLVRLRGANPLGSNDLRDCLNQQVTAGESIVMRFFVDTAFTLQCEVQGYVGTPANNRTQPLVDGVEQMQVLFGVDLDGNGLISEAAGEWLTGAALTARAVADRSNVSAVRLGLVVGSQIEVDRPAAAQAFNVFGRNINTVNSRRARQLYETTYWLPNVALTQER